MHCVPNAGMRCHIESECDVCNLSWSFFYLLPGFNIRNTCVKFEREVMHCRTFVDLPTGT